MAGDSKLLLWLLLVISSSACLCSELDDIRCLKTVLESVVDPNGILKSSWDFSNKISGSICRFTGVECWNSYESGFASLSLSSLGLQGPFPQGFEYCKSMIVLDLSSNNLSGPLPVDIVLQLSSITEVNLSYNSFSGEIPPSIGNLTDMMELSLQHNRFTGQIGDLAHLDNSLSGPIPGPLQKFAPEFFAGNAGLCGPPLDRECKEGFHLRQRTVNDASSIGAAVGFVAGFVVAFYFPHWFVFCRGSRPYIFRVCG